MSLESLYTLAEHFDDLARDARLRQAKAFRDRRRTYQIAQGAYATALQYAHDLLRAALEKPLEDR